MVYLLFRRISLNYPFTFKRIKILPRIAEASCVHQHRILCASDTLANSHPSKLRITFTNKEEENKG